jgi:hypothetical protein
MRAILAAAFALTTAAAVADDRPYAATGFAGWMLDNPWHDIFLDQQDLVFENAGLFGAAVSARVWRPLDGLDIEIEGQLARHFGGQRHWEVNAPLLTARWTRFPWDGVIDTSAAFGIGPSLASRVPRLERLNNATSSTALIYWMIEIEAGPPDSDWSTVWRVHHRSTGYGLAGEDGGSNALAVGLRRRF